MVRVFKQLIRQYIFGIFILVFRISRSRLLSRQDRFKNNAHTIPNCLCKLNIVS